MIPILINVKILPSMAKKKLNNDKIDPNLSRMKPLISIDKMRANIVALSRRINNLALVSGKVVTLPLENRAVLGAIRSNE